MISFTCDYNEGAHPLILSRLQETNLMQEPGYGEDRFTASAKEKIRKATGCSQADIFFLTGGTQTNSTVIDSLLHSYEGVVAVQTGHIAVHESGAIEASGHKVITLPQHGGKMSAEELRLMLEKFYSDPSWQHMVIPGMVYLSYPTEYGTVYTKDELLSIHRICNDFHIPLYIDGARLAYGLAASSLTLQEFAGLCDVFYIGGTKVGALCGEAVVFPRGNAPQHFFTLQKQHGAVMAKGRLLGIQFDTLFTDNLYLQLGRHGVGTANKLKEIFIEKHIPFYLESPTNQQFPILTSRQMKMLDGKVAYEIWDTLADGRCVCRFATSWATTEEQIYQLSQILNY